MLNQPVCREAPDVAPEVATNVPRLRPRIMGKVGFLAFPPLEEALRKSPIGENNSPRDTRPLDSHRPERELGVR
jgi:hypothetical protein